jgi:hypothetical protein
MNWQHEVDMAIYRTIQMSFWTDSKVVDDFTPEDRYFYLYLMTNPHTNLAGCYEVSMKSMSDETGYTKEVVQKLIDRLSTVHNVIRFCPTTKEVLILNWSRFNWTKSSDFRKPLNREIDAVKCAEFREYLIALRDGHDTVLTPSYDGAGTTVTVTDPVNNNIIPSHNTKDKNTKVEVINTNTDNHSDEQEDRGTGEGTKAPGWKDVIETYNRICQSLPKVTKVTEARKTIAKARLHGCGMEEIERLFQLAEESDFLSGRAGKWRASFDWLMKESNAVKVLDGNYQNRQEQSKRTGNAYIDTINNRVKVVDDWV